MTTSTRYIMNGKLMANCIGCGKPGDPRFMQADYCDDCVINDRDFKQFVNDPWKRFDDYFDGQYDAYRDRSDDPLPDRLDEPVGEEMDGDED